MRRVLAEGRDLAVGPDHREAIAQDSLHVALIHGVKDGLATALQLEVHQGFGRVGDVRRAVRRLGDVGQAASVQRGIEAAARHDDIFGIAAAAILANVPDDRGLDLRPRFRIPDAYRSLRGSARERPLGKERRFRCWMPCTGIDRGSHRRRARAPRRSYAR
jgi:hypothetical protein